MNRKERVSLNRAKRRSVWLFLFLMFSLYWIKNLYEDIDYIRIDKSFTQISINAKDSIINTLHKKIDSLKLELSKPVEVVPPPKPKWVKKDTSHVDTLKVKLKVDTVELKTDTLNPSN